MRGLRIYVDDKMLNSSIIDSKVVDTFFDMMIWLTAQYGPPIKHAVPKILNPDLPLHERCWGEDDPRTVFAWAEAEVAYLSKVCNMEDWSVQVAPDGNRAQLQQITMTADQNSQTSEVSQSLTPLMSGVWHENEYPGYFVDYYGRPTFFYDPRRCIDAGYLAKTLLPQFAILKIYAKYPPSEFGAESIEKLVQMTACHMGVGFNLLALSQSARAENWTPLALLTPKHANHEELPYLYGTLISLAAHRLTREQILATYGQLISQRTRKLIDQAYDQIQSRTDVLKLLKMLCKPTRSANPEHSHHRQVL